MYMLSTSKAKAHTPMRYTALSALVLIEHLEGLVPGYGCGNKVISACIGSRGSNHLLAAVLVFDGDHAVARLTATLQGNGKFFSFHGSWIVNGSGLFVVGGETFWGGFDDGGSNLVGIGAVQH